MEAECHFHMEVMAPRGLSGVENFLAHCKMNLIAVVSNFNGQVVLLTRPGEERFEFKMDPPSSEIAVATGQFYVPESVAWELLITLSDALKQTGFPHALGLDDPSRQNTRWLRHKWPNG